jgi:hypothetical protein
MNQPNYRRSARDFAIFTGICRTAAGLLMPSAGVALMSRFDDCYTGCVVMFTKLGLSAVSAMWVSKFLAVIGLVLLAFFVVRGIMRFVFRPSGADWDTWYNRRLPLVDWKSAAAPTVLLAREGG